MRIFYLHFSFSAIARVIRKQGGDSIRNDGTRVSTTEPFVLHASIVLVETELTILIAHEGIQQTAAQDMIVRLSLFIYDERADHVLLNSHSAA